MPSLSHAPAQSPGARLTRETLRGIFGAVSIPWTQDDRLDVGTLRHDVGILARSGIHGLYVGGSTSEFFAIELDDFKRLTDAFLEASAESPVLRQVGCPWFNGRGVLDRVRYAASAGADGIQFTYPGWEKLRFDECRRMLFDIAEAADGLPLIHYNTPNGGRVHSADEYNALVDAVPQLIGAKHVSSDPVALAAVIREAPSMHHLVTEYSFVGAMANGAHGLCSAFYALNPALTVRWYDACMSGDWKEAITIHEAVMRYKTGFLLRFNREGWSSTARDKALVACNPDLRCPYRARYPHLMPAPSVPAEALAFIRAHCPKLLEEPRYIAPAASPDLVP